MQRREYRAAIEKIIKLSKKIANQQNYIGNTDKYFHYKNSVNNLFTECKNIE